MKQKGFTLIELIIVFSIIAVLSAIGIVAFSSYNQSQTIQTARDDLANLLYLAKSRSFSQAVPSQCGSGQSLNGYEIRICGFPSPKCISSGVDFELLVKCGGTAVSPAIAKGKLPKNISFSSKTTSTSFLFPTITGGVIGDGIVVISGYGQQRSITVTSTGNIR